MDGDLYHERRHPLIVLNEHEISLVLQPDFGPVELRSVELLGGGFSNTNYRIRTSDGQDLVLRLYPYNSKNCAKEVALLKALATRVPVPQVLSEELDCKRLPYPFVILSFIQGTPLSEVLPSVRDAAELAEIGQSVGFTLAQIHALTFPAAGLIGGDLKLTETFPDFGEKALSLVREPLQAKTRARTNLGDELADRTLMFLDVWSAALKNLSRTRQLLHGDFNSKNILLSRQGPGSWSVTAVLDWEFALAGSPLMDLGNMLRFEDGFPAAFKQNFISGYERGAGPLEPDWRLAAAILDLSSQIELLSLEGERPHTVAVAANVVRKTLARG